MHNRIISLAADCCCIRLVSREGEVMRIFEGGELTPAHVPVTADSQGLSSIQRLSGVLAMGSWKSRWLLLVFPHGRASLFEFQRNRLILNSSFECPVNTSAVLMLDDDVDDCALVVFGTDEGSRASRVHVARLTFSSESLSVKPLKSWRCTGSVSSLTSYDNRRVVVGYASCEGVGVFDPFSFDDPSSPALGGRHKLPAHKLATSPERFDNEKEDCIQNFLAFEGVPVWVMTHGRQIITLTACGTMRCYEDEEQDRPEKTIFLGFDALGLRTVPTTESIVVCGWRGETALIHLNTGQVARFRRTNESARVDDFAISVSSDSKLLLIQLDADDGSTFKVFDFGRAALLGSSKQCLLEERPSFDDDKAEDELVFVGTDDDFDGTKLDYKDAKMMLREAWDLMVDESS